jgi:copper chaperone CopZ
MTEKRRDTALPAWLLKLAVIVVISVSGFGLFVTRECVANARTSSQVAGQTTTVKIPIEGMTCSVCAAKVKKTLKSVEGVQEAEISLERREAWVRYDEANVSPESLVAAINHLGYKAGTPDFERSQ